MKTKFRLLVLFALNAVITSAQESRQPAFGYSDLSLFVGYGTHGFCARIDLQMSQRYFKQTSTRFYLDVGGQNISFDNPNFKFDNIIYTSDCRLFSIAGGIAQEVRFGRRASLTPFLGMRAEYVRFKDASLVEAIGNHGIIRWSDANHTRQLGPVVDNAYGDAVTGEAGCRLAVILTQRISICASINYSPVTFSTPDSLFGKYLGEAPYENPYWVKRRPVRSELALRFTFQ